MAIFYLHAAHSLSIPIRRYILAYFSLSLCMCRVIADWAFYVLLVRDHTLFGRAIVAAVAGAVSAAMPKTFWSLYVICFSSYVCARGPFFISSLIKKYFSLYIYRWTVHSLECVPPLFKHLEMRFETIPLPFYYYCCLPACMSLLLLLILLILLFVPLLVELCHFLDGFMNMKIIVDCMSWTRVSSFCISHTHCVLYGSHR